MSTAPPRTRAPRGRVVIVGDSSQRQRLGRGLTRQVIGAETLFDAVGEVTSATSAEPVAAVVAPLDLVESCGPNTTEALRRLDPSVRFVVIVSSEAQMSAAGVQANGFDAVLVEPVTAYDLERAVSDEDWDDRTPIPRADDVAAPEVQGETNMPDDREAEESVVDSATPPLGGEITTVAINEAMLRTLDESTTAPIDAPELDDAATNDAPPQAQEPLGDTDLVHAVLNEPDGVLETALQLMRQQTGWTDLHLTVDGAASSAGASVDVANDDQKFGAIVSQEADGAQLRPWADWLARWLTLDSRYRDFRLMSLRDDLTSAWNRRFFHSFMDTTLRQAAQKRRAVTIMVFDIDDFKRYNDEFGHQAGDEILCETVRLLESVIRKGDRVCRMGGDEFVVVFADLEGSREPGSAPPETVEAIAKRFQMQICQTKFPKLGLDAPGTLSISGGLATYPWDGADAVALLRHADQLTLESKRKGKNVLTIGPGAQQVCDRLIPSPKPDQPGT